MRRRVLAGVSVVALVFAPPSGEAQEAPPVLKPFVLDENGKPIPRAEPVIPKAEPVVKPAPPAEPSAAATPKPVKPKPPGVVAAPKPMPAVPEPEEPGTIRITPTGTPRTAEQLQLDVANGYYGKKMYELAAPEYEKFTSLYPNSEQRPDALFRLGESYRHTGTMNAARNAYETLLAQYQAGEFIGPAAYRLADICYQAKEFRDAVALYRKASVRLKDPAVTNSAKFFTGRTLEALGQKADARVVYEDLAGTDANNPFQDASRLSCALLLKDAGRTAEALKQIQVLAVKAENPELKIEATVRTGLWSLEMEPPLTAPADAAFKKALGMPGPARWKEIAQVGILRIAFDTGKYQQVIDTFSQPGAQFSPDVKPELLLLAANSYRQLGNTAEAMRLYDQVLKDFANSVYAKEAQYERLKMLYTADDPQLLPAIEFYLAANPEAEKRDQILLMKAEVFFKKKDYGNAAPIYSTLELSRQLSGTLKAEALFKLGWCQMEMRVFEQATKAFTAFIDGYPTHKLIPSALLQRGIAWQSQKNLGAALADYSDIVKKFPQAKEREMAIQQKALILGQQGDNAAMADTFKLLLKDYPKTSARAQADYWIGWNAFEQKSYKEAVPPLDEARKLDKEQFGEKASIRLLQADYYLEDKVGTAREVDFYAKEGKTKVPAEILRWLGTELYKGGAFESAEKYFLMLTPRDEATPDDFLFLGRSQHDLEKFKEATASIQTYLKSVKQPTLRARGLLTLAKSQIALKALDDAQKSADEALTLQPEGVINGEGRITAGDIQMARGNPAEAAKLYETVYATGIDDPEVTPRSLTKAIQAYRTAGNDEKVKKLLNILQSRYPEYFQRTRTP